MLRLSFVVSASMLLAVLGGCDDPDPRPEPEPGPELSETPLWQVKGTMTEAGECFGGSVALADFDGDGQKDLVVGSLPCQVLLAPTRHPGGVYLFKGQPPYFSTEAASARMSWTNTHPQTSGTQLRVRTGEVNGDGFADLLVQGRYGSQVFLGQADLKAMLAAPAFRAPGNGLFLSSLFADLDGDGRDDLIVSRANEQSFYRATPGSEQGPFTLVHSRPGYYAIEVVEDLNGDGADDVLMTTETGGRAYFLGCKPGSTFACQGLLSAEPVRQEPFEGLGYRLPDMNGDGHREAVASADNGPYSVHLSEPDGTYASTAIWSTQGDPAFPLLGSFQAVGDLDGDGHRQDFVMGSLGRLYFFSPKEDLSQSLHPVWAWPRADTIPNGYENYRRYSVAVPGDLDGDGRDDLVVASVPTGDLLEHPLGDVSVFSGGRVPKSPAEPPHLMAARSCGLNLDPVNGKPDLTVDQDVLERTAHVTWKTFAADSCEVREQCVIAPGRRKLLRFSTSIMNLGNKAAIFPPIEENPDLYVFDECHGHHHLANFAAYELRDAQGHQVMSGRKQGYALVDVQSYCSDAEPWNYYEPMGISAGWSDIYTLDVPCQWVDVTDVPDGTYTFQVSVDTRDIVEEATVHPNTVSFPVRLQGDTVTVLP
ncbi:lysyl oxidase family protein [Myxococcus sp. MISCRS1]|uniref:lysyl oxidase family protein n=1 Tax=Myxococcus TaxID=32 RepID=UPI001CC04F96|nr:MULTISPECIES: lysyl oxidase family protein [unclassified Myxococcus]MBZ4399263.1 FG-GAP-like repeat-containing protein [Myxococcus sp. AS-1-15]MBZ4411530.1 FG-GAP-like repeat-containing protein [Myxococcus sp. XM-1-1-1]MCY0999758.1 lysyl oxidase family protein [Myxococcus sp. MISCRS1]